MITTKYRAWDTRKEKMYSVKQILWNDDGSIRGVTEGERENEKHYIPECRLKLMEYTGLNDGSKTEFCEGDILEVDGDWYRVEWEDDYGQWLAVSLYNQGDSMSLGEFHNCADVFIQGNIYENPELLNI